MTEDDTIELKRAPGTCCPEPGCDKTPCLGCEYISVCRGDPQKVDYCPLPRTCPSCGADCTKCELWKGPIINWDFSKMTEGRALYSLGVRAAEKNGKKGLNLPMPGKPRCSKETPTMPLGRCCFKTKLDPDCLTCQYYRPGKPGESIFIHASDEKPDVIVASEYEECRVKGAKKVRCADCRCKVWISPSTQQMLKRYPKVPVICIACFVKRAEKEKKDERQGEISSEGQGKQ